ncbi:MAG TPA: pyrroline-5-carboxylate reductase [Bryobacteraceae bacterium]|nr:pyrroline-5-carboxylate reductase [Bryobacteraceae bacterium]
MPAKLGFLGTGAITSAMVTGLRAPGEDPRPILLSPRNAATAAVLADRFDHVSVAASNQEVVDQCETIVIAVRPQIAEEVLAGLHFPAHANVISLVSGLPVRRLAELTAPATRISRAVPLPSAARRLSPTPIYPRDPEVVELFDRLGTAIAVEDEARFDALCVITATMAAYFAFAGASAAWLERHGIDPPQARDYVARIYMGLAQTTVEAPCRSFGELAADHATLGGTNEQVLGYLKQHGVFDRFDEALDSILRRLTGRAL